MPIRLLIPVLGALVALAPRAALGGAPLPDGLYAEIATPKGKITCRLEYQRAPLTVTSFVGLAEGTLGPRRGAPFFNGLAFHRVVPGFVIQGGDPLGTGEGGPGYQFADEVSPGLSHASAGVLSMANDGPDTNGSQFFITLGPAERLDYLYSVFGRVVEGSDVPARIVQGDKMTVRIIRVGAAAESFRADEASFAALAARTPKYSGEPAPGPGAKFDDPDHLLPSDPPRATYFNYKLNNFERATHRRVFARILAHIPAGAQSQQQAADELLQKLAPNGEGVLAMYVASPAKWVLSIGPSSLPRFSQAVCGNPKEDIDAIRLHFFAQSGSLQSHYRDEQKLVLAQILHTPGQDLKMATDAILDEMLSKDAL
ncbi:MAG TPA: peptidylprolyl isomerase [Opitutaceae bacterium]